MAVNSSFIDSVLHLEPRLATFDCDGTLWAGDAGEGFFDWELDQNLLSDDIVQWARPRYAAYKAGSVTEDDMCGEMVTMHRGLSEAEVQRAAGRYFEQHFASQIFPEMRDLVRCLQEGGCEVWAVSSTNQWVIRAAMRHVGIPEARAVAASVRIVDGKITGHLVRVPSGEGKQRNSRSHRPGARRRLRQLRLGRGHAGHRTAPIRHQSESRTGQGGTAEEMADLSPEFARRMIITLPRT